MTPGDTIDVDDLPEAVRFDARPAAPDNAGGPSAPRRCGRPGRCASSRKRPSARFLVQKLRENGWNISKTAEVIGTPRSNLYKKLEQYGISAGDRRVSRAAVELFDNSAAEGQTIAASPGVRAASAPPGNAAEGEESPNSAGQCAG